MTIESFTFSTREHPDGQGLDAYRSLYALGADVQRRGSGFHAEVTALRLHRLILFKRELSQVTHVRAAPRVSETGFSHFTLTLVCSGVLEHLGADGALTVIGPGQVLVLDMRRPTHLSAPQAELITVSAARDVIEAAAGSANGLHGRILGPEAGVLGDLLSSLIRHAPTLSADSLPGVTRLFVEALSLALRDRAGVLALDGRREAFQRREVVEAHIDAHLGDRRLNSEGVAQGAGLSRATLYRLLEPYGGVGAFILSRRLARARMAADSSPEPINPSAFGFPNPAVMQARFEQMFGLPLADYQALAHDPARRVSALRQRWASWMVEVR